ncbi:MAG: AbrB/MazE/SpoVT family DNA-binding domain-containing protein [Candidatus Njordarchaeales archaeon]
MEIVEVDNRGRILIKKKLRDKYNIVTGGKVVLIERKDGILIKPFDSSLEKLSHILKNLKWDRKARRRAEEWLLRGGERS